MWSKWGIDDIDMKAGGSCMFKFKTEEGMKKVLESRTWLVNSKPLMIRMWDPAFGMEMVEQTKVPLWVYLVDIPMEAWSIEGIKRMDFARVLVEFDVVKGFKEKIEIQYRDRDNNKKGSKYVKAEYNWKPDICTHCQREDMVRQRNERNRKRNNEFNMVGNRKYGGRTQNQKGWYSKGGTKGHDDRNRKASL
ncbi:RNA-directed DNA polymerase, eukaryota, reverse transcriptase zinc-binding domain protein [Tanacetum coccineum]|uniref:RNA-directed DNA polymerase, eukaryota, reverse transcriptase zinc-binding domain protein n=1 Tax=Tanacetum coccineum TaxID=301880 RepID=A0ABQ5HH52_9ASTR